MSPADDARLVAMEFLRDSNKIGSYRLDAEDTLADILRSARLAGRRDEQQAQQDRNAALLLRIRDALEDERVREVCGARRRLLVEHDRLLRDTLTALESKPR